MEYHSYLSFFSALSRAAGFSFLEAKGWGIPRRLFSIYCLASDCCMGFYVFRITSKLLLTPMNLPQILEWISTFLYVGQVFLKSLLLRKKNKQILVCVTEMNNFFVMVKRRSRVDFAMIWKSQYSVPNRFCMFIFGSQIMCLVLAYAPSFYNAIVNPSAVFITFPSYYYFYDVPGVKIGYLILDYITSNFCCLKTSAIEMLYLTFVSYYVTALKYLKTEIKTLFAEYSQGHLNAKHYQWWIDTHKDALRQIIHFREFVSSLLLIIYIYNLLNIATMTIFVTANGDMEVNQKMVAMVVVTVTLFYFFWDCVLTDELEALHSSLMSEAFTAELAFGQKEVKQCVMLSTSRCRLPLKITAGGVFAPSCWNFKELMTTTASFLVALWEIKNRAMRQSEI